MQLKDKLSSITCGTKSISKCMQSIKSLLDELAIIGASQDEDNLVLYCLKGLGPGYKVIVRADHARDSIISFEELHDKLVEHKSLLKREETQSENPPIMVNLTSQGRNQSNNGN